MRLSWPAAILAPLFSVVVVAQNASTSMQIPPLQWINVSRLITGGSAPIPLKDSSIAYDPQKRVLIIFGGESAAGTPVQNTWVLELDTLTWRTPVPPDSLRQLPPARAAAVSGTDFASNYRSGVLVFGGKGASGNTALNDVWYYSFQNEFWVPISVNGTPPAPRWNAAGGTAPRSVLQNVETYLWTVGGRGTTEGVTFDDVWQLSILGTVSAGVNDAVGTWSVIPTASQDSDRPYMPKVGIAGTVIPPRDNTDREGTLVVFGGCDFTNSTSTYNATCAEQDAHVLTLPTSAMQTEAQWTQAANCTAGMYAAALAPNRNPAASAFASEVFLFPGAIDSQMWDDQGGSQKGEIGVLMANSGVWARVIPAGDPKSNPKFPPSKEGAAIYSYSSSITGGTGNWSDIVVFGGKDISTGELTNDIWVLRAFNDIIDSSSDEWTGFGDGELQSGLSANGAGVKVKFLSQCATQLQTAQPSSTTTSATPTATSSTTPTIPHAESAIFDTSPVHKYFSSVSIALVFLSSLLLRYSSGVATTPSPQPSPTARYSGITVGLAAYAMGVVGFALTVNHNQQSSSLRRRDDSPTSTPFLATDHSRAALILFALLYGLLPAYALCLLVVRAYSKGRLRLSKKTAILPTETNGAARHSVLDPVAEGANGAEKTDKASDDDGLMMRPRPRPRLISMVGTDTESDEETTRRPRSSSRSTGGKFFASATSALLGDRRRSDPVHASIMPSTTSNPPNPSRFEVTNRPRHLQRPHSSGGIPNSPPSNSPPVPRTRSGSWMEARRSVGPLADLDYALSTGAISSAPLSPMPLVPATDATKLSIPPRLPEKPWLVFNILFQLALLFASVFWIVTFQLAGLTVAVVITIFIVVAFYVALVVLACQGRPRQSLLVFVFNRLRSAPNPDSAPLPDHRYSTPIARLASHGHPYMHQPQYRVANDDEDVMSGMSHHHGARSAESDPVDDDEDDDERQARIEEEMARRDVSIFTVPKRRLVVRN